MHSIEQNCNYILFWVWLTQSISRSLYSCLLRKEVPLITADNANLLYNCFRKANLLVLIDYHEISIEKTQKNARHLSSEP